MNAVIISPNFPASNAQFVACLKANGVNVFGIGDDFSENLNSILKDNLNDYYYVQDLSDYDSIHTAIEYYTNTYGKIDCVQSFNSYWLPTEARIRNDFSIDGVTTYPLIDEKISATASVSALINEGGKIISAQLRIADGYTVTEISNKVITITEDAAEKLGVKKGFITVGLSKYRNTFKLAYAYPALEPFAIDMMNYSTDANCYDVWASMVAIDYKHPVIENKWFCSAVKVSLEREYGQGVEEAIDLFEKSQVQESSAADAFVEKTDNIVLVVRADNEDEMGKMLSPFNADEKVTSPIANVPLMTDLEVKVETVVTEAVVIPVAEETTVAEVVPTPKADVVVVPVAEAEIVVEEKPAKKATKKTAPKKKTTKKTNVATETSPTIPVDAVEVKKEKKTSAKKDTVKDVAKKETPKKEDVPAEKAEAATAKKATAKKKTTKSK